MTKEVLIIGGNSFIGFYTMKEFLNSGYKVTVTIRGDRNKRLFKNLGVDCINFDLNKSEDIKNLPSKKFESIILLGGLLPANITTSTDNLKLNEQYIQTNVLGLINLLNYSIKNDIRRVISTTSYADTYNLWDKSYKIKETDPFNLCYKGDHCMYVISRNTAVEISKYYNEEYGMKNAIFRFPPVYGVGPHTQLYDNGVLRKSGIALFIDLAKENKAITVFGKDCIRDIVYVKDVAQAFVLATESEKTEGLYNIMSGNPVSLYEQACVISKIFSNNKAQVIRKENIENKSKSYAYSIEKAKNDFNYCPQYTDFETLMIDYKKELDNVEIKEFFGGKND